MFVAVLCAALVIFEKAGVLKPKYSAEVLKITIPEDLNYKDAFEDIMNKYTAKHTLSKIKTTDLGSLFEVSYDVCLDKDINRQEFINELRCRNGNLTIMLAEAPKIVKQGFNYEKIGMCTALYSSNYGFFVCNYRKRR